MNYIKGRIRQTIFQNSDSGFFIGIIRILDTDVAELKANQTTTITGVIIDANQIDTYVLKGEYINNQRYGFQFSFKSYEKVIPDTKEAIIEFLSSPLIKGCANVTALKIVDALGDNAINLIKENINNLMLVPGMTEKRANSIYDSLLEYSAVDDQLINLQKMGFTMNEATKIINAYNGKVDDTLKYDFYTMKEIIDFHRLDSIYVNNYDSLSETRILACIIESMNLLSFENGDIYYTKDEVYSYLRIKFRIFLESDEFDSCLEKLIMQTKIVKVEDNLYLEENYNSEINITNTLAEINHLPKLTFKDLEEKINELEKLLKVDYNIEQKKAIKNALLNRISIISGGPGTGKTTIVNAIVKLYIEYYKLSPIEVSSNIALLAPTGRASKKLSLSTGRPASTIHRFLKWNKNRNEFMVNEENKMPQRLIIVDEMSMIDTMLFDSLLKGLTTDIQLILVGDVFQLPSVGPGLVLKDIVDSDMFIYTPLETIYRQSSNSYIPYLAKEIKEQAISEEIKEKKDDFNFIECSNQSIREMVKMICSKSKEKGLNIDEFQILAPMYKGENGIDNLNIIMQELFNSKDEDTDYLKFGDIEYRVNDKVIQLVNNPDCNVYNGDIGYIVEINKKSKVNPKDIIVIDFDGNYVEYARDELISIKHAYAITIHKAQGSEFNHVILPISKNYSRMLYNKLIYTGVSRAKKSLTLVGDYQAFLMAVNNNYSMNRKTSLKANLVYKMSDKMAQ